MSTTSRTGYLFAETVEVDVHGITEADSVRIAHKLHAAVQAAMEAVLDEVAASSGGSVGRTMSSNPEVIGCC